MGGLISMSQSQLVPTMEQFNNLVETLLDLDSRVRQQASDIYDLQRENESLKHRLNMIVPTNYVNYETKMKE